MLPAGYGKSLVFKLIPYLLEIKAHVFDKEDISASVLILSPLNSIINEQCERYKEKALHVCGEFLDDQKFKDGKVTYVIGHPEHLTKREVYDILRLPVWQEKCVTLVVDEAHCVVQWGPDFRKAFLEIKQLRGLFPTAKLCALTATATLKMQGKMINALGMSKNSFRISSNIDRSNIKIEVKQRLPTTGTGHPVEASYEEIFNPLIKSLKKEKQNFPKTIVYAPLKWCGYGHELAIRTDFYGRPSGISHHVAQYHKPCTNM